MTSIYKIMIKQTKKGRKSNAEAHVIMADNKWGENWITACWWCTLDKKIFENILHGKLPNGIQLGKVIDGEIKHRAGYDLTFNAPKSVSLAALVGKDNNLITAHKEAVKNTLDYVETGYFIDRLNKIFN